MSGEAPRIRLRGITKRYGPLVANDRIDLDIARGNNHAIVGENGAGKTTLMRIIYGMVQPDAGALELDGMPVHFRSPADAIRQRIGMVHQRFELVDELSALENLVLGRAPSRWGIGFNRAAALARARELAEEMRVSFDWDRPAGSLTVGSRQRLEIMRLLYWDTDVLIFDEPTSVLTPQEADDLFGIMQSLAASGKTLIFITHKLREVFAVADTVTVMRRGRVVGTTATSETNPRTLSVQMVGEHFDMPNEERPDSGGDTALLVDGLSVADDLGNVTVHEMGLYARRGEIVGIAGIEGNGQRELVQALVGLRTAIRGSVSLQNKRIDHLSVRDRRTLGLAYISEDRDKEGASLESSLADNLIANTYGRPPLSQSGQLRPGPIERFAQRVIERFQVRGGSPHASARALSGGNLQRMVVGREMYDVPVLLVASHPTRGVDLRGIAFIHEQLLAARDAGCAVLLISEELSELTSLCDRLLVIFGGRIVADLPARAATPERLGALMTGIAA